MNKPEALFNLGNLCYQRLDVDMMIKFFFFSLLLLVYVLFVYLLF